LPNWQAANALEAAGSNFGTNFSEYIFEPGMKMLGYSLTSSDILPNFPQSFVEVHAVY
jgi:hypothetical protein